MNYKCSVFIDKYLIKSMACRIIYCKYTILRYLKINAFSISNSY